jgi:hypothetical protein
MSTHSDGPEIPIVLACELVGVSRQVRTTWIERKLVIGQTKGKCDRLATLDLACFHELVSEIGFDDARLAWPQVADAVRDDSSGPLRVVVDLHLKEASLARSDADVGAACGDSRLVRVVRLDRRVLEVLLAYDRVAKTLAATERTTT